MAKRGRKLRGMCWHGKMGGRIVDLMLSVIFFVPEEMNKDAEAHT